MVEVPNNIPRRGRPAAPLVLEAVRELTPEDLLRLPQAPKTGVPILQKLRAIHHRQAQLLASGRSPTEVAAIVGVTVQRLVQLQVDPAFAQLVAYYHDQMMTAELENATRLAAKIIDVGELAVDELRERLEDDDKRRKVHIGEIRKIAEFAMDRTVAPPKTALPTQNAPQAITINFGTPIKKPPATLEGEATESEAPLLLPPTADEPDPTE